MKIIFKLLVAALKFKTFVTINIKVKIIVNRR